MLILLFVFTPSTLVCVLLKLCTFNICCFTAISSRSHLWFELAKGKLVYWIYSSFIYFCFFLIWASVLFLTEYFWVFIKEKQLMYGGWITSYVFPVYYPSIRSIRDLLHVIRPYTYYISYTYYILYIYHCIPWDYLWMFVNPKEIRAKEFN